MNGLKIAESTILEGGPARKSQEVRKLKPAPRLSIGLPVYNGEKYLAESLDALLGQTYENFELIISDNASTDGTAGICHCYMKQDSRIRYTRQPRNIGAIPNHNLVVGQARGELFKFAAGDDLYARDLLEQCVNALDEYPHVILAHSWTALIDNAGEVTEKIEYPLATTSLRAPERFRSMLWGKSGDDFYGVIRAEALRRVVPQDSYHHSDRTFITEIALQGPFYQVQDWLFFRRDHPDRAERARPTVRARCTNMDPRRADRLRHPVIRLYAEYLWAYAAAIRRAPLSVTDRQECYRYLAGWMSSRTLPGRTRRAGEPGPGSAGAPLRQASAQPLPPRQT
jgi:glycosyltransferase involved in cell wall biosynthesis